jgi:hypothetical protein
MYVAESTDMYVDGEAENANPTDQQPLNDVTDITNNQPSTSQGMRGKQDDVSKSLHNKLTAVYRKLKSYANHKESTAHLEKLSALIIRAEHMCKEMDEELSQTDNWTPRGNKNKRFTTMRQSMLFEPRVKRAKKQ